MDERTSRRNFTAFMIHAVFLALTMSFIDVNTVVPNMIGEAGGTAVHVGILSAVMIGGTSFMQIFFAGFLLPYPRKKGLLLVGINLRVLSLITLGLLLLHMRSSGGAWMVPVILLLMALFSFSGSFANISYMDILGRAIEPQQRKKFLMIKQLTASAGVIVSSLIVKLVLTVLSYPVNYSILYISAGVLLLFGTAGFWMIREPAAPAKQKIPLRQRAASFRDALVRDRNLRLYLLLVNTSGTVLAIVPFLILFARSRFSVPGSLVGTYLLVQMAGGLLTNIALQIFHRGERYKTILYLFILIGAAAPLVSLLLAGSGMLYAAAFLFSGSAYALYQIGIPGVLLEISTEENRPVYTGIAGAGSIMNILYPVAAGFLIRYLGFPAVLLLSSLLILLGFFAARGIVCPRFAAEDKKT
jgi:MFS family permease